MYTCINVLQVISIVILSTIILAYAGKKCLRPPTYPATDLCPPWLHEADKVILKAISWSLVYTHPGHTSSECIQAAGRQAGIWSTLDWACACSYNIIIMQHMAQSRSWWTLIPSLLTLPEMEQADRILS